MRALAIALLAACAACSVEASKGGDQTAGAQHGYTVEIRANGHDQLYQVTAPDGRVAAARVTNGESASLDTASLQRAVAEIPLPEHPQQNQGQVSLTGPGFSLHAQGDSDNAHSDGKVDDDSDDDDHDHGSVQMRFGGFGMQVDADEGGPGDADDRAHVTLSGLSEKDARKFIDDAEDLSSAVRSQMLLELGLDRQ